MFTPDSRYANSPTLQATMPDGTTVSYVRPAIPGTAPIVGYHRRSGSDRLDLVAVQHLNAPTGFWRLCDANNAVIAGALAARVLIGVPRSGQR